MKIKIRRANGYDVVRLTRLLERGATEQRKGVWYPSPSQSAAKKIAYVLSLIDQAVVIVAEAFIPSPEVGGPEERKIVGAISMSVTRLPWSDDWMLTNEFFYVREEYRDTDVADQLLSAAELFADTQKDQRTGQAAELPMMLGMLTGVDTELKDELFKRRNWVYSGGNFIRGPKRVEIENDGTAASDPLLAGDSEPASGGSGAGDSE